MFRVIPKSFMSLLNLIHIYDFFSQKQLVIFSLCLASCNLLQSKKLEIQGFAQVYSKLFWCFYHELMELCRLIYCRYIPHLRGKNSHSDIIEWVDPKTNPCYTSTIKSDLDRNIALILTLCSRSPRFTSQAWMAFSN